MTPVRSGPVVFCRADQLHIGRGTARVSPSHLQLLVRRTLLVVEVMVFSILEDRLRGNRKALAERRVGVGDRARYVGDDVRFAVLRVGQLEDRKNRRDEGMYTDLDGILP